MSEGAEQNRDGWLAHVPLPLFAAVMGVSGLGLAWRKAHVVFAVPEAVGEAILSLAAVGFIAITVLYGAKILRHPAAVKGDVEHPIRRNFFPAFSISLILLGIAAMPHEQTLSLSLWASGTILQLVFTLNLMGRWLTQKVEIQTLNPAWFIPVVGNILVPICGAGLGLAEVSWFFFSIGIVFWMVLFILVFHRVVFLEPLLPRLVPTLFIFIAPAAIGFVAYLALNGGALDNFARILFYFALFQTLLLFTLARVFLKIPFALSWWAYTFPLDAMAIAALEYGHLTGGPILPALSVILLGVATVVVALVFARTLKAMADKNLFVPE